MTDKDMNRMEQPFKDTGCNLVTTPAISKRMANTKGTGSKAETLLAHSLWHAGCRYRRNYRKLPGSPDIVFTKQRLAVFVDGEFWHGKDWETGGREAIKSNRKFWISKIEANMERDRRVDAQLKEAGWRTLHFWSKDVLKDVEHCVIQVLALLHAK